MRVSLTDDFGADNTADKFVNDGPWPTAPNSVFVKLFPPIFGAKQSEIIFCSVMALPAVHELWLYMVIAPITVQ